MQSVVVTGVIVALAIAVHCAYYTGNSGSRNLNVVTLVSPPYVSQESDGKLTGIVIDVLDLVVPLAGYTYNISLQPDGSFGLQQPDGSWDGLVGSVISGKADVAASDLFITPERDEAIDFTTLFNQLNIRILLNKATGLSNIKYQIVSPSGVQFVLQPSTDPEIVDIFANIQANNGFVASREIGLANVLAGGYGFIDDGDVLQTFIDANPTQLELDPRTLLTQFKAFGVKQGSPLRDKLGIAISKINELGQLSAIYSKYNFTIVS